MKKSELLEKQANQEDNDLKAFGLYGKAQRERRCEKFVSEYFGPISRTNLITQTDVGKWTIYNAKFGTVDIFPKANKLLIRKENKWVKNIYPWINKHLLI